MIDLAAGIVMLVVTTVDGIHVAINPAQVTRLHPSREAEQGRPSDLVAPGIRCVISLTDGKFVSVVEDCDSIRRRIEAINGGKR